MRVLVIGNGGREDALCWKLAQSPRLEQLYCAPGNGGTLRYAENVDLASNQAIVDFAVENKIDLVVVGPENPLCSGLVDLFDNTGIKVFGPNQNSAQLEGSKDFTKEFLMKYNLPTAQYVTVYSSEQGKAALTKFSYPLVIKADGLCAGKGVGIFHNEADAVKYLHDVFDQKIFGNEGNKAVIEEFLVGKEASLLCFVTKDKLIPLESARDYKKIFEGDLGENTGGVGCYSPNELFDVQLQNQMQELLDKISAGLKAEGLNYHGILFIGFMIAQGEPKILEFNVRFGDPETEVILPRLESDLIDVIEKCLDDTLTADDLVWSKKSCMTVILTSAGYPGAYEKGKVITGLDQVDQSVLVFHNNTQLKQNKLVSAGGRVLSITMLGDDFSAMREIIYRNIDQINFENKQFRKDIGLK